VKATDACRTGAEQPAETAPMSDRSDAIVLFGASGDLAKKMLFPTLAQLSHDGRLPARIVGVAASDWDDAQLRKYARRSIEEYGDGGPDDEAVTRLLDVLTYVRGDYREKDTFAELSRRLDGSERPLLYLAIPPSMFTAVIEGVVAVGLHERSRVVLEKPFGRDLDSARELNRTVLASFPEEAVFRIDHYLGKEEVLDLLVFRLANTVLEPAWNRHYIDSVQITMSEAFGVEGRGAFYDEVGALRDVVQNHLLQVLALVAIEPPISADAQALRDEKVKVLRAVTPLKPADVVRGQFEGYRDEKGVAADSDVETSVALKLGIDNWRWAGVPFYIRAGKHLPVTATEVLVEFKRPPQLFFADVENPPHPNHLLFRLKPAEQVSLGMQINDAGEQLRSRSVDLTYAYCQEHDGQRELPYARLFSEAMDGQQRLFARADGVEAAWRIVDPVLTEHPPAQRYKPGTWGPAAADDLIAGNGSWHDPAGDADD
jgi:glucose-6-phosphate 1-dehydrogenase